MSAQTGGRRFTVDLSIGRDEFERLYRGQARIVLARDKQGRSLSFPALSLRPFLAHDGIRGTFVIRVDENNRLLDIHRHGD
jgi:hypothetical protein